MGFGYAVYFTERAKNRVLRWDPDSGGVEVAAGDPKPYAYDQTLKEPYGLAFDPSGALLIADKRHNRIACLRNRRLDSLPISDPMGTRQPLPLPEGKPGYQPYNPVAPTGLFIEKDGSVICSYADDNTIYRIHPGGRLELLLGIPPRRGYILDGLKEVIAPEDVPNTPVMVPTALAMRKDGALFYIERFPNVVRMYRPSVGIQTLFPLDRQEEHAAQNRAPDVSRIQDYFPPFPASLVLDAQDTLYICEMHHGCILKVDLQGGEVTKVVETTRRPGHPSSGYAAMAFGPDGVAWVMDAHHFKIEAYEPKPKGRWLKLPQELSSVQGQPLALPQAGSGIALGN